MSFVSKKVRFFCPGKSVNKPGSYLGYFVSFHSLLSVFILPGVSGVSINVSEYEIGDVLWWAAVTI